MSYNLDNFISDSKNVLDKISVKANSAVNVSKAYVEKAQIRVKLNEKYCELGKLCFDMHETGTDETGSMKLVLKDIKSLKSQLEYAEEASGKPKICPICSNKNASDDHFCSACGEKL